MKRLRRSLVQTKNISSGAIGIANTLEIWHEMVDGRDLSRLGSILSDDAVFHSPVVHTPQVGKARVQPYLTAAFHVFLNPTFRYVREIAGESDAVLEFVVEIDGITVNGVDMLKFDKAGLICEFKVMLRPLKAVNIIHEKMGAMLAARSSGE